MSNFFALEIPSGQKEREVREARISLFSSETSSMSGAAISHTNITIGEGAYSKILVRFENGATPATSNLVTTYLDLHLARDSHLQLFVISALSGDFVRESFDTARLDSGATLEWTIVNFDVNNGTYLTDIALEGERAELDFAGAYGARICTEQEHRISVRHLAPRARSRSVLKSALKDSAHLKFRGLIQVDPRAFGTDAYLSNRNLILEDGARAESLPQLKIETDDVACTHGATTGGPRPEELFYLMSRGLDRAAANNLLVQGHLGSVFGRLPSNCDAELERVSNSFLMSEIKGNMS